MVFLTERIRRFYSYATRHNISSRESRFRIRLGVTSLVLALVVELLLRFLTTLPRGAVFALGLPLFFCGVYCIFSGRASLCMGRSIKGTVMPASVMWTDPQRVAGRLADVFQPNFFDGEACDVAVGDKEAQQRLRRIAVVLFLRSLVLSAALSALVAWA